MIDDLPRLVTALADQAEAVCRAYLPAGRRHGRYWTVGDVRNSAGRSMWVRLKSDEAGHLAGKWQDAATGEHGDLLDVIRETCCLRHFSEVVDEAAKFLAMPIEVGPTTLTADNPDRASSAQRAARLFAASEPIRSTLAERYLRARGITHLGGLSALRFHPHCYYKFADGRSVKLPALIAATTNDKGRLTGALRTYLDPAGYTEDSLGKALVDTPKKALGDLLGHAVRFGRTGDVLAAGEGLETVLSLRTLAPDLPHAAALSAAHLAALSLPPGLRRLYLIRDNDASGRWATSRLAERAAEAGIEALVIAPAGKDLNEDLRRLGPVRLRAHLNDQFTAEDRHRYLSASV